MFSRLSEIKLLFYRIGLVFLFYSISRLLFIIFNHKILGIETISDFLTIIFYGIRFDLIAILYINILFVLLSILPFSFVYSKMYQKGIMWLYFVANVPFLIMNFVDITYYKFVKTRFNITVLESVQNESNKVVLFLNFIVDYWYVFLLFFVSISVWIFLYKKRSITSDAKAKAKAYYFNTLIFFLGFVGFTIYGIRGDFKKSTRPLTLVDANKYVKKPTHADAVLNAPFSFIRTFKKNTFENINFMTYEDAVQIINPIKQYKNDSFSNKNVVVFIIESFGNEYIGAMQDEPINDYVSFTPFLDSLAQHSMVYKNAFGNGYKSIHAMSSVVAGIPSYQTAFTSSSYVNQPIESLVSILNQKGYETSFFHGAPNGSMGFLGFSNILGFDNYYGKDEFNNDDEFDGVWAIWDMPFFQFMKSTLDKHQQPFFATMFSATSHEPFQIPKEFENKFKEGFIPIHKCVKYTDASLKAFFEEAKKSYWYNNTVFVFTADHTNQVYYEDYNSFIKGTRIPIIIFDPSNPVNGSHHVLTQQIDIYPTILDYLGYEKPFRSFGNSLYDQNAERFVVFFAGNFYILIQNDLIFAFDGAKIIGVYNLKDVNLSNNLINDYKHQLDDYAQKIKAHLVIYSKSITEKKL